MLFRKWNDILQKRQDRLVAFFDAVLAIAITILALEIAIPAFEDGDALEISTFFQTFTGYLISFLSLGAIWYFHAGYINLYGLTGKPSEVLMHFVLMFLITLFQPATNALNQHRGDTAVRLLYLSIFVGMNVMNILLLRVLRNRNERKDAEEQALLERLKEMYDEISDNASEQEKLAMHTAFYVNRPEIAIEAYKGRMSDEQTEEIAKVRREREEQYRSTIHSTIALMLAIMAAVIAMMFSLPLCYLFLGLGIVAIIALRIYDEKRTKE